MRLSRLCAVALTAGTWKRFHGASQIGRPEQEPSLFSAQKLAAGGVYFRRIVLPNLDSSREQPTANKNIRKKKFGKSAFFVRRQDTKNNFDVSTGSHKTIDWGQRRPTGQGSPEMKIATRIPQF